MRTEQVSSDRFEELVQAHPHHVVEADGDSQYVVIRSTTYVAKLVTR